jgi:1-acyl-sn-glycerol-3-phosphate acyltransferase
LTRLTALLRLLFVTCLAWPVVLLWLGIHVRHRERLPRKGPAIVAANHNSHLDILALLSLFPLWRITRVQPAAAADYFCKNACIKWLALHVVGIIPVVRGGDRSAGDPLQDCYRALEQGKVLVIFPEGSRGEPEQLAELKAGIWHLAQRFPNVPVIPVFMHGLGRAMPKGSWIPVPFFINIGIGKPLYGTLDKTGFLHALRARLQCLKQKIVPTNETEEE